MKPKEKESFDTAQDDKQPATPSITDLLVTALLNIYEPAEPTDSNVELKTSIDIIEEMASIAEVEKWEIAIALKESGFKLKYTDAGVFWCLNKK